MSRLWMTATLGLMILGCSAGPRPVVRVPVEVRVPVPVPCKPEQVEERPQRFPSMSPQDDPWDKLKALIGDHLRVRGENTELRAANTGCKPKE